MRALLVLALLLPAPALHAEVWRSLYGDWSGAGTVRGMQADVALSFRPLLQDRGRQLSFRNRMRGEDGAEWLFQAEAIYLCDASDVCRGHWYDSRGSVLALTATPQARSLVVEWGDAATEQGRTTYAVQADGGLVITDEVQHKDGTWRTFGTTTATRTRAEQ